MKQILAAAVITVLMSTPLWAATAASTQGDQVLSAVYQAKGALPAKPGRVIKVEAVDNGFDMPNAGAVYRVLYSATDGVSGALRTDSGLVYLPQGKAPKQGWPIVAWQHGTTGVADACAPSWTGPTEPGTAVTRRWLGKGYAVLATDYQGLGTPGIHPYVEPKASAYAVLDLIRASLARDDWPLANQVALHGWSEGEQASVAAAMYGPDYAPELNISGVVASGTPDLSADGLAVFGSRALKTANAKSYFMYIAESAAALNPHLALTDLLTDPGQKLAAQHGMQFVNELPQTMAASGLDLDEIYHVDKMMSADVLSMLRYPDSMPQVPVFLSIGGNDRNVPTDMQLGLQDKFCAAGVDVAYKTYEGGSHASALMDSIDDGIAFIQQLQGQGTGPATHLMRCPKPAS